MPAEVCTTCGWFVRMLSKSWGRTKCPRCGAIHSPLDVEVRDAAILCAVLLALVVATLVAVSGL